MKTISWKKYVGHGILLVLCAVSLWITNKTYQNTAEISESVPIYNQEDEKSDGLTTNGTVISNWNQDQDGFFETDMAVLKYNNSLFFKIALDETMSLPVFEPEKNYTNIRTGFGKNISAIVQTAGKNNTVNDGLHSITSSNYITKVTGSKTFQQSDGNVIELLVLCECESVLAEKVEKASQKILDNKQWYSACEYRINGKTVNPEYLSEAAFTEESIVLQCKDRSVVIKPYTEEIPKQLFTKRYYMSDWTLFGTPLQYDENTIVFAETENGNLEIVGSTIEDIFGAFSEIYDEEENENKVLQATRAILKLDDDSINGVNLKIDKTAPEYSKDEKKVIVLEEDIHDFKVKDGEDIYLDLNGHSITSNYAQNNVITVAPMGSLVIAGSGTIKNTNGKATIFNEGKCAIQGDIKIKCEHGKYGIWNKGDMEISGNVTVDGIEDLDALIENGWEKWTNMAGNDKGVWRDDFAIPVLSIYSGKFSSGNITLQNDEGGYVYIYDGEFRNIYDSVFANYGIVLQICKGDIQGLNRIFLYGKKDASETKDGNRTFIFGGLIRGFNYEDTPAVFLAENEEAENIEGKIYLLGGEVYNTDLNINKKERNDRVVISEYVYIEPFEKDQKNISEEENISDMNTISVVSVA